MFYCSKWVSSCGRLKEPWLEGKYKGNIPRYINTHCNYNLRHVGNDLIEVVRSNSKNTKHRISLRLSAELSYGVCSMYRKRVKQLLEDSSRIAYFSKEEVRLQQSLSSSGASQAHRSGTCEVNLCDFEDDDISESTREISDSTSVASCINTRRRHCSETMDDMETSTNGNTNNMSPEYTRAVGNETTVIDWSNIGVVMDPDVMDASTIILSRQTVSMQDEPSVAVNSDKDDIEDEGDSNEQHHSEIIYDLTTQEYVTDSSIEFEESRDQEDSDNMEYVEGDHVYRLSTIHEIGELSESVFEKKDNNKKMQHYSDQQNVTVKADDENRLSLFNVSKNYLKQSLGSKIQDTFENFMIYQCLESVCDCCVSAKRKKKFPFKDEYTKISKKQMIRNISNPLTQTRNKTISKCKGTTNFKTSVYLLSNPGILDRCIARRKYWTRNIVTRQRPYDKLMYLQADIQENMPGPEDDRLRNIEDLTSESVNITFRKSLGDLEDTTRLDIMSPNTARTKCAVEMLSIEPMPNPVITKPLKSIDLMSQQSDESILYIEIPSLPPDNDNSDESRQLVNVSDADENVEEIDRLEFDMENVTDEIETCNEENRMSIGQTSVEGQRNTGSLCLLPEVENSVEYSRESDIVTSCRENETGNFLRVNILLPKYLHHKIDCGEIKLSFGSMRNCDDIKTVAHSDQDTTSSSDDMFSNFVKHSNKLNKEWGEGGVYEKLVRLWRHHHTVSLDLLFSQGSRYSPEARAKMFQSILRLRSKGLIKCTNNISGQLRYISRGSNLRKFKIHHSD